MSKKIQAQIDVIQWFHHFDEETFGFETKGAKGTPNKEEIIVTNLMIFSKENQLNQRAMSAIALGKKQYHKGWSVRFDS